MFIIKSFIKYIYEDIIEYFQYSIAIYLEKLYIYNIRCYKYITFKGWFYMSKSELGVKTNLVSELLMISYFFIDSLLKKFIFKEGNLCIKTYVIKGWSYCIKNNVIFYFANICFLFSKLYKMFGYIKFGYRCNSLSYFIYTIFI